MQAPLFPLACAPGRLLQLPKHIAVGSRDPSRVDLMLDASTYLASDELQVSPVILVRVLDKPFCSVEAVLRSCRKRVFWSQPVSYANNSQLAVVGEPLEERVLTVRAQWTTLILHATNAYCFSDCSTNPPPWICMNTPLTSPLAGLNMRQGIVRPESRDGILKSTPESRTTGLGKMVSPFHRICRNFSAPTYAEFSRRSLSESCDL